jgi:hypothetical protein
MSEEKVDLVRAVLEAWNRSWREGDPDLALEMLDPDVVLDFSGNVFNHGSSRGMTAFGSCWPRSRRSGTRSS